MRTATTGLIAAGADIWWVAKREMVNIVRDKRLRMIVFVAPFAYALLFCFVYMPHSVTKLPTAVLLQDHGQLGRQLVRMFDASPRLSVTYRVNSLTEIRDLMLHDDIDAAVVIPRDLSRRLKRGRDTYVTGYVNAGSMVSANTAAKALNEVTQTFSAGAEIVSMMKHGERLQAAKEKFMPVKMDFRPLFNPSFNYSNFLLPGLFMAILQQVILLGLALSWTGEKEDKSLATLVRTSRSPLVLMTGKALPYLVVNFLVAEVFLRLLFPFCDIPMEGSWAVAIPFTALFTLTIVTWGLWVSGLCRTRLFATQLLMFIALPSFVLSGFTWPTRAMPYPIQVLGQMLPLTHFVNGFRNVYLGAAEFRYVADDFAALGLFTLVNIVLSYFVIRRFIVKPGLAEIAIADSIAAAGESQRA